MGGPKAILPWGVGRVMINPMPWPWTMTILLLCAAQMALRLVLELTVEEYPFRTGGY